MYQQQLSPVGGLAVSALLAALPLLTVFVLLGVMKVRAHVAAAGGVLVSLLVAVLVYGMPTHLALLAASEGAVFGLFPIMWIVFTAIWLYQVTVVSGRFDDLRAAFGRISDDPRAQAIIIAFCFGGLLEALAGFGAPVAITGVMLLALGFPPVRAACIVLLANTAPVAFGAVGTPIITAGTLTGIDHATIGALVGHQTPVLAAIVPLLLVVIADGRRGVRQLWPLAIVVGLAFAVAQWMAATFLSVELTDIVASLIGLAAAVVMLRFWTPAGTDKARADLLREAPQDGPFGGGARPASPAGDTIVATRARAGARELTPAVVGMAFFPYLLVIAVFSLAKLWTPLTTWLAVTDVKIPWPGLAGNVVSAAGKPASSATYTLPWLSSPGTLLLLCGIVVAAVYRVRPAAAWGEFRATAVKLRWSFLTVALVLALAYVMNLAGMTLTIGYWIAGAGAAFAFLSPVLGWLGTAVTGSDTSANALFATLQQSAAERVGLDPALLVAANTSGGVVGKMISPQNLTIAATAVGILGQESTLLRKLIGWSLGLLLVLCTLTYLQTTPVMSWMLP